MLMYVILVHCNIVTLNLSISVTVGQLEWHSPVTPSQAGCDWQPQLFTFVLSPYIHCKFCLIRSFFTGIYKPHETLRSYSYTQWRRVWLGASPKWVAAA